MLELIAVGLFLLLVVGSIVVAVTMTILVDRSDRETEQRYRYPDASAAVARNRAALEAKRRAK